MDIYSGFQILSITFHLHTKKRKAKCSSPCTERISALKVPFNFHFKIEMEKDIFAHLNFDFKIKN